MNWRGCERKRSWLNLRNYAGNFVEVLRRTRKTSVRMANVLAEPLIGHLLRTRQKSHVLYAINLAQWQHVTLRRVLASRIQRRVVR
jgi:hypothetical protein